MVYLFGKSRCWINFHGNWSNSSISTPLPQIESHTVIFSFPSWFPKGQTTKQTIGIQKSFSAWLSHSMGTFRMRFIIWICFAGQSTHFLKYAYLHYIEMKVRPSIKPIPFNAFIFFPFCCYCCWLFFRSDYMTQENNKQFDLLDSKYLPFPLFRFIYCGYFPSFFCFSFIYLSRCFYTEWLDCSLSRSLCLSSSLARSSV